MAIGRNRFGLFRAFSAVFGEQPLRPVARVFPRPFHHTRRADVVHAQFKLALARSRAGEPDYATEVEDVLRKVPEQRRQISELEDR
jgi:hypothetical protein